MNSGSTARGEFGALSRPPTSPSGLKLPSGSTSSRSNSFTNAVKAKLSLRRPLLGRRTASGKSGQGVPDDYLTSQSLNGNTLRKDVEEDTDDQTPLSSGSLVYPMGGLSLSEPMDTPTLGVPQETSNLTSILAAILLEPASLMLAQLAPVAVSGTSTASSEGPYSHAGSSGHNAQQSATSLTTYLSASENASEGGHHSVNANKRPFDSLSTATGSCSEQLAASALSLPAVSIAALARAIKCLQWIGGNDLRSDAKEPLSTGNTHFELGALLQSSVDVMASYAAQHNVEVVLYHGASPDKVSKDAPSALPRSVQEVHCKGNDSALSVAFMTILDLVIAQSKSGDTIELGLNIETKSPPRSASRRSSRASAAEEESDENLPPLTPLEFQLDITHSCSPYNNTICDPVDHLKRSTLANALCSRLNFTLREQTRVVATKRTWTLAGPLLALSDEAIPAVRPRSRRSVSDAGKEPTLHELFRFCETSLRGKKAVVYSTERSVFARYLTSHLTLWGMNTSHVANDGEEDLLGDARTDHQSLRNRPGVVSRMDSGVGVSEPASPPNALGAENNPSHLQPPSSARSHSEPQLDPSIQIMCIDDDIGILRKQLQLVKTYAPNIHLHNALLNKRPALITRRTRSSAHIRTNNPVNLAIFHFTSLDKYRYIRDVVQSIIRTSSPMCPLPEVYVLPKPVGPRRLLTVLHTSVRRPPLDPSVAPIATSPSSPGGHFFMNTSARPSPAASGHQDFDTAFGENVRSIESVGGSPPTGSAGFKSGLANRVSQAGSTPSSPRAASTEASEYMEYMTKTAVDYTRSASSGIVIQSPDGKASGLFFLPGKRALSGSGRATNTNSRGSVGIDRTLSGSGDNGSEASPAPRTIDTFVEGGSPRSDADATLTEAAVITSASPISTNFSQEKTATKSVEKSPPPSRALASPQHIGLGPALSDIPLASTLVGIDGRAQTIDSFPFAEVDENNTSNVTSPLRLPPNATARSNQATISESPTVSPTSPRMSATPSILRSPTTPTAQELALSPTTITRPGTAVSSYRPSTASTIAPTVSRARVKRRDSAKTPEAKLKARGNRRSTSSAVPPIKVLIVEDNPINQTILSTFMKRRGIAYDVANNGQEAVDKWKIGGFHLVLMDIQLPVKDGITATKEIRTMERAENVGVFAATPTNESAQIQFRRSRSSSLTPGASPYTLPVIIVALTASSLQTDRLNALAAGCNDFITKPVSLPWLQQKLLQWGSMSILSSFSGINRIYSTPSDQALALTATSFRGGLDIAKERAASVASHLHIDPRPALLADNASLSSAGSSGRERTNPTRNESFSSTVTTDTTTSSR